MGEWLVRVGTTCFMGVVYEGCLGFAGLFALVAGACLGPTLTLGVDLAVLLFFPVGFSSSQVGLGVTGLGVGLGEGGDAALMTRIPRTTWFQPCPNLSCSAVGCPFGVTGG
jgi:hypothetical protein